MTDQPNNPAGTLLNSIPSMETIPKLIEAYTRTQADYRISMFRLDLAILSLLLESGLVAPEKAIERFELFLNAMSKEEQDGPKGSAFKGAIQFVRDNTKPPSDPKGPAFGVIPGGKLD
ncbi:MAG TPA: hypothetical protein VMQ11_19205 [Alphaproteobacteria bacterium]|nr:hypothetical protein [Alphaproteobacteria bacterium]